MVAGFVLASPVQAASSPQWVEVSQDRTGFVLTPSGERFTPWGFNYDHDEAGRLIEDYWRLEWAKVEEDFREMKELGANVVRVHLQLNRFMRSEQEPDRDALRQLARLLQVAERLALYLDLTGLGCYHAKDVPAWYDALPEDRRWAVQAKFWEAVARECKSSPAVFCYDLMNEPVAPAGGGKGTNWLGPAFAGKHFVQWIALERRGRVRPALAREWVQRLAGAIRKEDPRHLITVGLVSWSLDRPGLSSGFVPSAVAADLDFLSVHLYPETSKLAADLDTLRGFNVGKPVVIEETFPLKCSAEEFAVFLDRSRPMASGWIGFYWGKTLDECRASKTIPDAMMLGWLKCFQRGAPR
ncbi:MAG: cellulase family glycosylhydrolase [Verrucomicrobia bacterium]|nr:cellulase family glycosylhydrolase [Verrucomicrobiota bacterium]